VGVDEDRSGLEKTGGIDLIPVVPNYVLYAAIIEIALLLLTTVLLVQPKFLMDLQSVRIRKIAFSGGMALLGVTFCWSFILGSLLTVFRFHLRLLF